LGRTSELRELLRPARDLRLHAALFLQAGKRELERLLRRGLEGAFSAPVEVHRCAVELEQDAGGLDGAGVATDVIAREAAEVELAARRAFPEEMHVERFRKAFALRQQLAGRGLLEAEQHVARLHLAAPAMGAFDVERR